MPLAPLPPPDLLRPDVAAALRGALEERLEDHGVHGKAAETVIRTSLADRGAGCHRDTLLRALELVLDQVAAAFPVTAEPADFACPECGKTPKVASRTVDGPEMWWTCPDGHRWSTDVPSPMPQPSAPIDFPSAGAEMVYSDALTWVMTNEWSPEDGRCHTCSGYSLATARAAPETPYRVYAGHQHDCGYAAVMKCFGGEPAFAPVQEVPDA